MFLKKFIISYPLTALMLLASLSIVFSLSHGSATIQYNAIIASLAGQSNPVLHDILLQLRLPRTLAAFVCGGLLALAGTLMQVLLRNPLADPYILGISGGGAVFALLGMLFGISGFWLTGETWLGSLMTISMVFFLARKQESQRLLLTGVALASGFSAIISFILVISPTKNLHSMLFWLMGDLSYAHFPTLEAIILGVAFLYSFYLAKELNILVRGEREAKALGIYTERLALKLYCLSALLTAAAVALAGCIGFIGLIIPHFLRLVIGHDYRLLLPGSVLLGGTLLTVADTFSRTLLAPQQLPVGIMMAFLGIPVFLFLLQRKFA